MADINLNISYLPSQIEIFYNDPDKYNIIAKGRRVGVTKGAAHFFVECAFDNVPFLLWGDTINGNIDRYYERYFLPILNKIPQNSWNWNQQKRELKILNTRIDFRSSDKPENWEGFGYNIIFLNEAGIILEDDYLYSNAVLPMMLDYSDSILFAAGVPKGKLKKDGTKHKFYELYEKALAKTDKYKLLHFTTYSNPLLKTEDIEEIKRGMSASEIDQEIYGQFIDMAGKNPFAFNYDHAKHESKEAIYQKDKIIYIKIDFNLNPFAVTFSHFWHDEAGPHWHTFDEASISNGSIPAMAELIKSKYGDRLHASFITGDAMGNRGDISQRDNATLYKQLQRLLMMSDGQLKVVGNPTHENSRADVNFVLANFPDYKINPDKCPGLCLDMRSVQCDAFGQILKRNRNDLSQRADFLDTERYGINTFLRKWIDTNLRNTRK